MVSRVNERMTRSEARARNRSELLKAARELIVSRGYEATQLDEVAARAGLTKGAVYSIFGSKRELLIAVVEDNEAIANTMTNDVLEDPGTAQDLLCRFADSMLALIQNPDSRAMLTFQVEYVALSLRTPELLERGRRIEDAGLEQMAQALAGRSAGRKVTVAPAQASLIARHALAMLQGIVTYATALEWSPSRDAVHAAMRSLVENATTTTGR